MGSGGVTREWRAVNARRLADAYAAVRAIAREFPRCAPPAARARRFLDGLRSFLASPGAARDALAVHPALDYWLFLWESHFSRPSPAEDWILHFGAFQSFPASLAAATGRAVALDATLDPQGRFYLYGTPWYLEFPEARASRARATVRVARGVVTLEAEGGLKASFDPRSARAEGPLKRLEEAAPGVVVDDRGWLQVHGVTMHGLLALEDAPRRRFAEVIGVALRDMAERDPALHAEMTDLLRVLVPLNNPMSHGSVSSSYVNLRGLIALSPSESPLLQAETLIHEFCHMKMNQLLVADPVLLPGQSGQVFYSPWRPDARRLRGLLLGAHAFLAVAAYLARSLAREDMPEEARIEVMVNVARRVAQVGSAMRALSSYGRFTEFGRRFVAEQWRRLGLLEHAILWFPPALLAEQRAEHEKHRARYSLAGTGFHKSADFADLVPRAAYLAPKEEA